MKVISVCNQKGGVGKTTVTYHLAWGLYELGYATLLIDVDPQGNLSTTFNQDSSNALEIFSDTPKLISQVVIGEQEETGISLVTSNIHLAKTEAVVSFTSYTRLKKALSRETKQDRWDYVMVDCPPSLGVFTVNALVASDYVLIPSLPYYFSLLGLKDLLEVVESMNEDGLNPKLKVLGILLNQIDRTNIAKESLNALEENFSKLVFQTKIPRTIKVEEALQERLPIWQYEPGNPASVAYKELVEEFVKKVEEKQ